MKGVRVRVVIAWALAMILALQYVPSGAAKINPSPAMVARFEAWGYSGGLARLIGLLELTGGFLVLVPSYAAYGAAILAVVMLGAIYTHLSTGIGAPNLAAIGLAIAGILISLRARDARGLSSEGRR